MSDGEVRVILAGELDLATAPEADRRLREAQAEAPRVVLDLDGLTFIDATGLRVLLDASDRATSSGGDLLVRRIRAGVRRLLELTGTEERLTG